MIELKLHRDILLDDFYVKHKHLIILKILSNNNVFGSFSNFPEYTPIAYARNLSRKL